MEERNVYQDISRRTEGDVYIGVVGPVRTGKSTFIKRFMDSLVLPNIRDEAVYRRTVDELPQSAAGRTIMTTEPKFIPEESVEINLGGNTTFNVRMIDCVGYIVNSAIGYSEESGIPYEKAIVKNSYIGRTFIKPSQKERMKSVKIKLNPIADKIKGKRVVIIDDSIVRGTTVDRIVTMLKEAGAKEVHMRISSPPFMWPCYYGTDIPSRGELIACNHTIEEITKLSKADSLGYLPVESLREMIHNAPVGFCDGCFTGNYPAPITKETFKGKERGGMNFDENNKKDN